MKTQDSLITDINRNAPVLAECEISIRAGIDEIWELLTDINCWPMWMEPVSSANLHGSLETGTQFTWKNNGMKITSTLQVVETNKSLVWTGSKYGIKAIHTWQLKSAGEGITVVKTVETMEGFLSSWVFSSSKLESVLNHWLEQLKSAAEN